MDIELREITRENLRAVLDLDVAPEQRRLVASNAVSIAQAYFWRDEAWFRAIYADGAPAGFVMLALEPGKPPYVWRLMVSAALQRRGVGRAAMGLIREELRRFCPEATELRLSHVPADGDPGPFYVGLGFAYTGELDDGERVMSLALQP